MKKIIFFSAIVFLLLLFTFQISCVKDIGPLPQKAIVSQSLCDSLNVKYSTDINTIMITYCATSSSCHGSGASAGNFSTYTGIQPYASDGELRNRVIVVKDMPLGGPPLADSLLQKIDCWLNAGFPNN